MYELRWSHAEKKAARRAFDLALGRELEALILEAKDRAARIGEASELWALEGWLTGASPGDRPKVRLPLLFHAAPLVRTSTSRRSPDRS